MPSQSSSDSIQPFGLLVYRIGELGQTEILVQTKDGMPTIPNVVLEPGETYIDAAARTATKELGIRTTDLLVNTHETGSDDHPSFRYVMIVATPRTHGGVHPRWRWAALASLEKVAVHSQMLASSNALAFAIRCMDEPSVVLDPARIRTREARSSGIFSTFSCFS
ncbi:hypothetical protein F4810DRAFT_677076 [Camillea tinctor]|nr:hypothetical protein F4810DRAFT_677076 [Camillea tinctor]